MEVYFNLNCISIEIANLYEFIKNRIFRIQ